MRIAKTRDNPGIELAVEAAGGFFALAKKLKITGAAVAAWRRVPVAHVLKIERIYRIPRHELRPDIYPPERRKPSERRKPPARRKPSPSSLRKSGVKSGVTASA